MKNKCYKMKSFCILIYSSFKAPQCLQRLLFSSGIPQFPHTNFILGILIYRFIAQ